MTCNLLSFSPSKPRSRHCQQDPYIPKNTRLRLLSLLSPFCSLISCSHGTKPNDKYTTIEKTHKSANHRQKCGISRHRVVCSVLDLKNRQNSPGKIESDCMSTQRTWKKSYERSKTEIILSVFHSLSKESTNVSQDL